MIVISHRGNIFGKNLTKENTMPYIQEALDFGIDCEIDVHYIDNFLYLGHDSPDTKVDLSWLEDRKSRLWIHCKNLKTLSYFYSSDFNYFWHEQDKATITSKGYIWAYPGTQPIKNSIAVLPEIFGDPIEFSIGFCTDHIDRYAKNFK